MNEELKKRLINKADEIADYAKDMKEFAQKEKVKSYIDWGEQIKFEIDNIISAIAESETISK